MKSYTKQNTKEIITTKDTIYLITNDADLPIPDLSGLSSKVASDLLKQLGIKVKLEGVGYVKKQSIEAGTKITEGLEMNLILEPKFTTE